MILAAIFIGILVSLTTSNQVDSSGSQAALLPTAHYTKQPVTPSITAKAYSVFDVETGEVLFSKNADTPLPIASITKLFTASAAITDDALDTDTVITDADTAAEGRPGKLEAGQRYTLRELLFPLLLESSNDAAEVFSRTVDELSFPGVTLADASGLSPDNVASASALAANVRQMYRQQAYLFDITKLPRYIGTGNGWVNNSPVRDLPGYQGGKHGYTEAANRTLVAIFTEPSLQEREIGYVILGSDDLRADMLNLRDAMSNSVRLE